MLVNHLLHNWIGLGVVVVVRCRSSALPKKFGFVVFFFLLFCFCCTLCVAVNFDNIRPVLCRCSDFILSYIYRLRSLKIDWLFLSCFQFFVNRAERGWFRGLGRFIVFCVLYFWRICAVFSACYFLSVFQYKNFCVFTKRYF